MARSAQEDSRLFCEQISDLAGLLVIRGESDRLQQSDGNRRGAGTGRAANLDWASALSRRLFRHLSPIPGGTAYPVHKSRRLFSKTVSKFLVCFVQTI